MNNSSSNIKIITQFFKNNHFKMIFFILVTIFLTYAINEQYYKNKKPYSYVVDITIIENDDIWWIGGDAGNELLYFMESKGYESLILNRNSGVSNNLGIKTFPTSKVDKDEYIKIRKFLNEFKDLLIIRSEEKRRITGEVVGNYITTVQESEVKVLTLKSFRREKQALLDIIKNIEFRNAINQDSIYFLKSYNENKLQKVNNNVMQKLIIAFILSIVSIFMILWIKLFIREIKNDH